MLQVEFRDYLDRDALKPVTDLSINLLDNDTTIVQNGLNESLLSLPLDSEADQSAFYWIKNASDTINREVMTVSFFYQRSEQFVNRACGFKTQYTNLAIDIEINALSWIQDLDLLTPNLEDEDQIHLIIYH
ncbi:DUF6452 family protein [Flavobacteriaceae bacterium]|nr:DUF6452 family protein [Flavobacteriaceae bacterium]